MRKNFEAEPRLFLSSVLLENRNVTDLLTADWTFVNDTLARQYGITGVLGPQFRRVTLKDENRWGLLGKGAFELRTSYSDRTSPVLRGAYVLDRLLGTPPHPPPPNVVTDLSFHEGQPPTTVRQRLEATHPKQAAAVPTAVREATRRARAVPAAVTKQAEIAHALVKSLHEDGRLDQHLITQFAEQGRFDETNAAIAALANVTVATAENMMLESRAEGVMILAKVAGLSWSTVKTIIRMHDELTGGESTDLDACKATYERLRSSTAQQVMRFHRMQQNVPAT